ncbi:MAG TPA: substrate-binding domain-containing protein [Vicinamibacterales bacterium]|nr:substrate-binding domain-containing protein [Vicinamibacterales bacterium]
MLAVAAIVAMSHVVIASSEPSPRVLRVCSDPNNLPFSNKAAEGFENRIATLVAERMGARLEYVWWAQRRGFIRNTLRAGLCDAVMGLPSNMEMAATTSPYYRSSYMFVTRRGTHQPSSLDDPYLAHATIGVHLIGDDAANTPPAHALSKRRMIDNVRGYSIYGDYKSPNPPAALISAVSNGDIDVAIAWGPLAGYFAKHSTVPLQLNRVLPESDPPYPFVFDVSMGVARSNTALRDELNRIVAANREQIDRILRDFGVPIVAPHTVATR